MVKHLIFLQGQCVMLLEDGTSYEGEVAGVGILGGKGLMRLPNGDVIRGTFHGSWGDGIKINATFTKAPSSNVAVDEPTSNQAVTKYELFHAIHQIIHTSIHHLIHAVVIVPFVGSFRAIA